MNKATKLIKLILKDKRYTYFLMQRLIKGQGLRNNIFKIEKYLKPSIVTQNNINTHPDYPTQKHLAELDTKGLSFFDGLIPPEQIETLRKACEEQELVDGIKNKDKSFALENVPADVHVAHVKTEELVRIPHVMDIANHPIILECVAQKMGCKPLIDSIIAWWSLPGHKDAEEAQNFHRDIDALSFYKFFIYLTDVDDESGPHIYVQHSHNSQDLIESRRFTDQEVRDSFGNDNILHLSGKAGTCFLENTYGIHKGLLPKSKRRLIFQVIYTSSPTPYGPKKPILEYDAKYDQYDSYTNKLFIQKRR